MICYRCGRRYASRDERLVSALPRMAGVARVAVDRPACDAPPLIVSRVSGRRHTSQSVWKLSSRAARDVRGVARANRRVPTFQVESANGANGGTP